MINKMLRLGRRRAGRVGPPRVVVLTNFIPPYRRPFYAALGHDDGIALTVLLSSASESDRDWTVQPLDFDHHFQSGWTIRKSRLGDRYEPRDLHIPLSTPYDLWKLAPDIVVSAEMGARTILAAIYCGITRTPLIVWATLSSETEVGRSIGRMLLRRTIDRFATGYLTNGASGAAYLRSHVAGHHARVLEIGQGSVGSPARHVSNYDNLGAPEQEETSASIGPVRLLYVGSLSARKGVLGLLTALQSVDGNWILEIFGDGPLREEVRQFSQQFPRGQVRIRQFIPWENMVATYAEYDCLIFPTARDEWGLVVNEALLSGVPVCGSTGSQAAQELIEPGKNGWLFDPSVMDDMVEALSVCVRDCRSLDREEIRFGADRTASIQAFARAWRQGVQQLCRDAWPDSARSRRI